MTDTVLSALDATFLELEQQDVGALMHIGGVMVFDPLPGGGTPTREDVIDGVAARMATMPRYTHRLSSPHVGGLTWPRWETDERFDVGEHVRHVTLPTPGTEAELLALAADFYSHPLDRRRPLWELLLIDGLDGGGWALAHKTHHCLVDGVGSVGVAEILFDATPDGPPPAQEMALAPAESPRSRPLTGVWDAAPDALTQSMERVAQTARGGMHAARHPREAAAHSAALLNLLVHDELTGAPHTSLNVPIGSTRSLATGEVALEDLKLIRRALGGSVNDVVLAACTSGLRALLLGRAERPPMAMRAMVPMNVRETSERLALGNRISSLFVELPVAEPVAHVRYRQIVAVERHLKESGAATGATTMLDLASLAPPVLHSVVARSLYANRLFNITITNVPGPQVSLYALGSRLQRIVPIVPLAADHALGVAVFSYSGRLTFGVIADAASVPDIETMAEGITAGIDDLLELARHVPAGTAAPAG